MQLIDSNSIDILRVFAAARYESYFKQGGALEIRNTFKANEISEEGGMS